MEEETLSKALKIWLDKNCTSLDNLKNKLRAERYGRACEPAGRDWVVWGPLTSDHNHKITNKGLALMPGFLEKFELTHFYFFLISETQRKLLHIATSHSSPLKSFQKHRTTGVQQCLEAAGGPHGSGFFHIESSPLKIVNLSERLAMSIPRN